MAGAAGPQLLRLIAVPCLGVAGTAAVRAQLDPLLGRDAPLLLFVLPTVVAGYVGGLAPGLLATVLGALSGIYLFIEPRGTLAVTPADAMRVVLFVVDGVMVSALTEALHRSRERTSRETGTLRQTRDSLRSSETRLTGIIESAMDAIISVDERQRIVLFNPAAERVFRCAASDAVGQPVERFIPERFRARHPDEVRAFGRTNVTTRSMGRLGTLYGLRADGEEFPIEASISQVLDPEGQRLFTVILRDVTERVRVEQERDVLYRAASEANRMKDEFLATLSHELRTPLNVILGWCWRLQHEGQADAGQRARALTVIERNARAQHRLIEDLLDVSRIVSGQMHVDCRPTDLRAIIEAAVDAARPAAENRQIALTLAAPGEGSIPVRGDAQRLQQVAWNLLSNALKFTPPGGRVGVQLETGGAEAVLTVRDTGPGIPAEFLPHVFDRFRQYDSSSTREQGGLGLGLSIVRHIVELHGGSVQAASEGPGAGATFTIRLPLLPAHVEVRTTARWRRRSDDPESLVGLHVLLVDDAETGQVLADLLRDWGADVQVARSARDALASLQRAAPDVIVADVRMPAGDGFSFIREVRRLDLRAGGGVPAIAMTAWSSPEERARALAAGYQLHVAKPVEPEELRNAIITLIPVRATPPAGETGSRHASASR